MPQLLPFSPACEASTSITWKDHLWLSSAGLQGSVPEERGSIMARQDLLFPSSGSASLAECSAWFPGTKSRSTGVRIRWKREIQGVVGRISVWSQAGVLPPAHRPSSILAGAWPCSILWCESHGHSEGEAGGLPLPSLSPAFKCFTVTVLSLVPCCGTYDCSKLAAGSVLTSPNAHIMERQKSVNEWIRGTAASSTNFFFYF